jgi:hypothetical protein
VHPQRTALFNCYSGVMFNTQYKIFLRLCLLCANKSRRIMDTPGLSSFLGAYSLFFCFSGNPP